MSILPKLAITMGDPSGIGPEIIVKALSNGHVFTICKPFVVADAKVMSNALKLVSSPLKINVIDDPDQSLFQFGTIDVIDLHNIDMSSLKLGIVQASSGAAAFTSIIKSIDLVLEEKAHGVITTPINKDSINKAVHNYSGHKEIFAEKTGTKDYSMMLVHGALRVVHVSTHISLRQACDFVTKKRVYTVIKLSHEAMRKIGIQNPSIAVAGLNPHADENGLFGDEERDEILPAIEQAKPEGLSVEGPLPADTVFIKALVEKYDVVVVMYHDQGHIPLKTLEFTYNLDTGTMNSVNGVNITLGLPIVRSSVDHGTAFDQAGKGCANPQSLIEAIEYGARLSG